MDWKKRGVLCLLASSFFTVWLSDFYRSLTTVPETFGPPRQVTLDPHEDTYDPPTGPKPHDRP